MQRLRNGAYLATVIAAVVLPSAVSLLWYQITRDPTLRPLGITKKALQEHPENEAAQIVTIIEWGGDASTANPPVALAVAIQDGFAAKGVQTRILVVEARDLAEIRVTYRVGASQFGPYSAAQAAKGITAAAAAFRMVSPWDPPAE